MALKPATSVIASTTDYSFTAVQTGPKMTGMGKDETHQHDKDGVPRWTVDVLRNALDGSSDLMSVSITSPTIPNVMGPCEFEGLVAAMWFGERPKQGGLWWAADSVKSAIRKGE